MSHRRVNVEFDVSVPMRDGAQLAADVYLPEGQGPFPTLLTRTPYDKSGRTGPRFSALDALAGAQRGYAVVMQDVRGRHGSPGDFITFKYEAADGYDTVEWIAQQAWSDGQVGMFGRSYVGATQWLAATAAPPHLKAMAPGVTASDYHEGWAYQGGAFNLGFNLSWSLLALAARNFERLRREQGWPESRYESMLDAVDATGEAFQRLPLTDQPRLSREAAPYYYEWLEHPADDAYWQQWRIEDRYGQIAAPALNIGGWYDIFLLGTLRNYQGLRDGGATESARTGTRLVIGPWSHASIGGNQVGSVDFGTRAASYWMNLDELTFEWFDQWLKGREPEGNLVAPVRIFVMGENVWRDEEAWPLARAVRTPFYLHSQGKANSRHGDGVLSTERPGKERPDTYLYNPLDPVPTKGGPLCCSPSFLPSGPFDHSVKEDRRDVLVYTAPPLEADVEVTGPITMTLWAMSSAVDTDFTAMLLDVGPCGCARNLAEGILRARYRNSPSQAEALVPGRPTKFSINLVATSNVFKKDHSIRIEVSSSNFPRFDRNLNTGNGFEDDTVVVATNTVFHDDDHPSFVELPIIPR